MNKMDLFTISVLGCIFITIYLVFDTLIYKNELLFNKQISEKYNMNKLYFIAKTLYENNKRMDRVYEGQSWDQVLVDLDELKLLNLSKDEITIVEGVLMTNGYRYYEI